MIVATSPVRVRVVWHFYVNYGFGWEHAHDTESELDRRVHERAYRDNCVYPWRVVKRLEPVREEA